MAQTINYPNTNDPMIHIQDDGSIYLYAADGTKRVSFEGHITRFYNTAENEVLNVTADTSGDAQVIVGTSGVQISVSQGNEEINITAPTINLNGAVNVNGSLNTN
jgi:phage baseplate assembly protein gpV